MNSEHSYHYMYRALEPDFAMYDEAHEVVYTPEVLRDMFLDQTRPIEDQRVRYQEAVDAMNTFLSAAREVDPENRYGYSNTLHVPTELLFDLHLVPDTARYGSEGDTTDDVVSFRVDHTNDGIMLASSYIGRFENPESLSSYLVDRGGPYQIPLRKDLYQGLTTRAGHLIHAQISEVWQLTDIDGLSETEKTMDDIHVHLTSGEKYIAYSTKHGLDGIDVSARSVNRMLTLSYLKMAQVDLSMWYWRDLTKYPLNVARLSHAKPGETVEVLEDQKRKPYLAVLQGADSTQTRLAARGVLISRDEPIQYLSERIILLPSTMVVRPF